jgi:hypothetical protein
MDHRARNTLRKFPGRLKSRDARARPMFNFGFYAAEQPPGHGTRAAAMC